MLSFLLPIIYVAFISLGLPDALLGAAWPVMRNEFNVPLSYAGIVSMIIALGTVFSSLKSDALNIKFGTGKITAASVGMTAVALFGFSVSTQFWQICLWAIPYGLGAGSVDAALNNYVALHYESRHMSWLHCFWGVGATLGPYIMGAVLTRGGIWNGGYRIISIMQIALTAILIFSLPLWKKNEEISSQKNSSANSSEEKSERKPLSLKEIFKIPGAKEIFICFFCYSAVEQTSGLWAASFLTICKNVQPETAATFASLFYFGIMIGRAASGFITFKLNDTQMIRLGLAIILLGVICVALPLEKILSLTGLVLIGLGCAPIYPSIIHSTPAHFGAEKSQAIIGVQMASAYIGTSFMPPLFGLLANHVSIALFPAFLGLALILMAAMHNALETKTKNAKTL
ncbi:MAG: MFS transporter [Treponemataceae bacterium]|nr:MFS transporter [Treponemataceae bacterium]